MRFLRPKHVKYLIAAALKTRSTLLIIVAFIVAFLFGTNTLDLDALLKPEKKLAEKKYYPHCTIKKITDGDSIDAICDQQLFKVRLWGIDAPEMRQGEWGKQSRQYLEKLLGTQIIALEVVDIDRYQRAVARIYTQHNQQDINLAMVEAGKAVAYHSYLNDKQRKPLYQAAEKRAKTAKKGIWSRAGNQQDPAKWRRLNR